MSPLLDVLYYAALGLGLLLGKFRRPPLLIAYLTQGVILTLVGSLGFLLGQSGFLLAPYLLLLSVGFAAFLIGTTTLIARLGIGRRPSPHHFKFELITLRFPGLILASLVVGSILGIFIPHLPYAIGSYILNAALLLLLFLVGWDIKLSWQWVRGVATPLAIAVAGSLLTGVVIKLTLSIPWNVAFAIVLAFGWYTLAGPVLTASVSASMGLVAFLVNFLRENFTMIGAPWIGAMGGPEGIAACGGATSMDTTLYFAKKYGHPDAGSLALSTGIILTLVAPLLLGFLVGGL